MYKEKYINLINAWGEDEEAVDLIQSTVSVFPGYVAAVYEMETKLPYLSRHVKGEEYKERYSALDQERSRRHEAAISGVKTLNRLAEQVGVEPLFTGDPGDRLQVAAFCIAMVDEIFQKRVGVPQNEE